MPGGVLRRLSERSRGVVPPAKYHRTGETAYAITSLSPEQAAPERLLELWRGHWGIANRLHWVRDVTFGEDRYRVRSGAAPPVLAALRNLVSGLLRLVGHSNMAAALRYYGWRAAAALQLRDFPLP